jgi:hypothetical protein
MTAGHVVSRVLRLAGLAPLYWLGERPGRFLLPLLAACFLLVLAALLAGLLALTDGRLVYTLDDSYIQMSLAWHLAQGHYGINAAEASAPASSILYPFLLAPFAWAGLLDWGPLVLNAAAGAATMAVLGWAVCRWGMVVDRRGAWRAALLLMVLAVAINLPGLVFSGLEHSLHVLATLLVLLGLLEVVEEERAPWWLAFAIVLAPMLRFEGYALALLAVAALLFLGQRRAALDALLVLLLLTGAFELLMARLGLPPLPSSVLVKSDAARLGVEEGSIAYGLIFSAAHFFLLLKTREGFLFLLLMVAVAARIFRQSEAHRRRGEEALVLVLIGLLAAQLLFGEFTHLRPDGTTSFARYEIYALAGALAGLALLWRLPAGRLLPWLKPGQLFYAAAALLLLGLPYVRTTVAVPFAARGIAEQQAEMRRFVVDYWKGDVAVNDLGLMSYRNPYYVLDLWGLGSEAARKVRLQAEGTDGLDWMGRLAREKGIGLAVVYDSWFPGLGRHPPEGWRRLAVLRMAHSPVTNGDSAVAFYGTDPARYAAILAALNAFQPTLGSSAGPDILGDAP